MHSHWAVRGTRAARSVDMPRVPLPGDPLGVPVLGGEVLDPRILHRKIPGGGFTDPDPEQLGPIDPALSELLRGIKIGGDDYRPDDRPKKEWLINEDEEADEEAEGEVKEEAEEEAEEAEKEKKEKAEQLKAAAETARRANENNCSGSTAEAATRMGNNELNNKNANQQVVHMAANWVEVTASQAQAFANSGTLVVAGKAEDRGSGHTMTVIPGELKRAGDGRYYPMVEGGSSHGPGSGGWSNGTKSAGECWSRSTRDQVKYYTPRN